VGRPEAISEAGRGKGFCEVAVLLEKEKGLLGAVTSANKP